MLWLTLKRAFTFNNYTMRTMLRLSILICVIVITNTAYSQAIEAALQNYTAKAPQEKLYVQFDNVKYGTGQTVWYKAYIMNGFQPSLLSKNFYIDWYDDNGKLISSSVTPIISSFSTGNFKIPENYVGTNIHAMAYTKWMRNFDPAYFFNQDLQIVSNKANAASKNMDIKESSIQILPESGNFIAGKLNVLAFKVVNGLGFPENSNGVIRNTKGDSVTSFRTVHDGMGKFQLMPIAGQQYTAVWNDVLGILHKTPLPAVLAQGVNLNLEPGRSNRIFHVQRTKEAPVTLQQLTLVGQMNGAILFMAKLNLSDKESVTSTLPLSKMLSGILQLTLFDANDKPVCERIVFVKNEDYKLNISANIDTLSTVKRGKNVVEIDLKDSTYANLSLSITDANTSENAQNNIISHLLLNGDLSGKVFKSAYYFSSNADSVSNHLDLVMLTNGWRKYNWDTILNSQESNLNYPKDTTYQILNGKVLDYANRKVKKPETINLIFVAKDSSNNMITVPILEDGSFASSNAMLYDTTKIYFKINGSTPASNKNVIINSDFVKPDLLLQANQIKSSTDTAGFYKLQYIIREQAKLDSLNKRNTLKEVTVFSKQKARIKELDRKYTFGAFSGEAIAAFDMSTLENASHTIDIFDFLTGKVPGLEVGNAIGGIASEGVINYRGGTPSFFLNEMPIPTSQLRDINVSNIAYVKVFSNFVGGLSNSFSTSIGETMVNGKIKIGSSMTNNHASSSAIVMYTKKGDDLFTSSKNFTPNGLDYKSYSGYVGYKEFYSPNYAEKTANYALDLRSTLLWDPWITLDKFNQKVRISFYNNDVTAAFRLVLEGMDGKGKLVSINKILK